MASAVTSAVQVVPFAAGHILAAGKMSQPPTTAQCEQQFGIACYQAFQLQKAYNLAPLFAKGIEGKGETIVIVDAFGSPSIASDLKTFDSEMGLPNPPSLKVITPAGPITTTAKNCTSTFSPTGPTCAPTTSAGPTRPASTSSGRTRWPRRPTSCWSRPR